MKKRQSIAERIQYHADRMQYAEEVGNDSKADYHAQKIAYITAAAVPNSADEIAHTEEFVHAN